MNSKEQQKHSIPYADDIQQSVFPPSVENHYNYDNNERLYSNHNPQSDIPKRDEYRSDITYKDGSFLLSSELTNIVTVLSMENKESPEEIMRKAIALIKIAIKSQEQGANLAIVKNGQIITEIVGF